LGQIIHGTLDMSAVGMNYVFFFFWIEVSIRQKWQETASLCVVHDAKFPSFSFWWILHPQTKQMNLSLIIWLYKKLNIMGWNVLYFMICLCTFHSVTYGYSMTFWYWSQIDGYKIHPKFQPIEKLVTWKIKWLDRPRHVRG
jgi:hypothetical protein